MQQRLDAEGSLDPDSVADELGQARRGYGGYQVFGDLLLDLPNAPAAPRRHLPPRPSAGRPAVW